MIHGENLILAINGTPLAASKSCSLSKSCSFIEVASPTDGAWESFVPSKKGWSMSSDCLLGTMDAYKTLDAAWKAGTALTIRFFNTEYDENETGTAYIDKLDLQCAKGNLAKMSVSLKGSGPLSEYGVGIEVTRTLKQTGKYYYRSVSSLPFSVFDDKNYNGSIYSGSFTLTKRTLVQISCSESSHDPFVILSKNSSIVTKAQNAEDIYQDDYYGFINGQGKIWLDAGTWYVVESLRPYTSPTYKSISL